jgi:hypothetical protein
MIRHCKQGRTCLFQPRKHHCRINGFAAFVIMSGAGNLFERFGKPEHRKHPFIKEFYQISLTS